jgi:hypothetical protein
MNEILATDQANWLVASLPTQRFLDEV